MNEKEEELKMLYAKEESIREELSDYHIYISVLSRELDDTIVKIHKAKGTYAKGFKEWLKETK